MTKPHQYLSFDSDLPTLINAVLTRKLQALMPGSKAPGMCCMYAGPCAIGILLPVDLRPRFDDWDANDPSFANLANHLVFEVSDWELEDWNNLQGHHDNLLSARHGLYQARKSSPHLIEDHLTNVHTQLQLFFNHIRHLINTYEGAYHNA